MPVPALLLGSFLLGVMIAAAVLVGREFGVRRDLRRIGEGLAQLASGNAAFRIRSVTSSEAISLADSINAFAESVQREREDFARRHEAHHRLVTNISHDLRTPITSIAGYADALRRGIGDEPERYLDILAEKSRQLVSLTDDLFYMSRIDSGDLVLSSSAVDLCELARQQLLGFEPQFTSTGATVEFDLPPGACLVVGDESALRRLIDNVVSNALRHAQGMTRLAVALELGEGEFVLRISDDGKGMTDDEHRLFERGSSGGGGGTGLGLAIARELARGMGMELIARTGQGSGVEFLLRGPRYREGGVS